MHDVKYFMQMIIFFFVLPSNIETLNKKELKRIYSRRGILIRVEKNKDSMEFIYAREICKHELRF